MLQKHFGSIIVTVKDLKGSFERLEKKVEEEENNDVSEHEKFYVANRKTAWKAHSKLKKNVEDKRHFSNAHNRKKFLDSTNKKALYRRAHAFQVQEKFEEAGRDL